MWPVRLLGCCRDCPGANPALSVQSLANALPFMELPRLLPLLRCSAFALALEMPSASAVRMHCVDAGVEPPQPKPGFQPTARLLPPSIPTVHAIVLKVHAAHAFACELWAACSRSSKILRALDAPRGGREDDGAAAGDASAAPCWSAIVHYARFSVAVPNACMDAGLAHAAHVERTGAAVETVCGAADVAPTDADRATLRHTVSSSGGPFAAARATMQALAHLVTAGRLDMVEAALVVEAQPTGGGGASARGFSRDFVYALLQVAHAAPGSMQDAMQQEVGLYEARQELRSGGLRTAVQEVELRLRGADPRGKALAPLHELHWSHIDRGGVDSDANGAAAVTPLRTAVAAAAAAAAAPPTPAATVAHAAVWQRMAAAHDALLLLRRLAMLKGAAGGRERTVGEFVLSVLMRRPEFLVLLEAAVQRLALLQHEPPFVFRSPPPGHPAAAPSMPAWARELLCRHDRSVRSGRVSGDCYRRYSVAHAVKAALYWRKQAAHNSGEAHKGGARGNGR